MTSIFEVLFKKILNESLTVATFKIFYNFIDAAAPAKPSKPVSNGHAPAAAAAAPRSRVPPGGFSSGLW